MEFSRRNKAIEHKHRPNAPNLIEKEFRRQLVVQFEKVTASEMETSQQATAAAVRLVYDQLRRQAMERGIPESLIPSFENARSTVYRIRRKREPTQPQENESPQIRGNYKKSEVLIQVTNYILINLETKTTSAGEGSRSGSSAPESPISSGDTCTSPEQTEPLCLVTWKNNTLSEPKRVSHASPSPHTSPILYQTLQSPNSSDSIPVFQPRPMQLEPVPMPFDPNVLRYYGNFPPNNLHNLSFGQSEMFQHYAAMHAEYLRSLVALNMYPRF